MVLMGMVRNARVVAVALLAAGAAMFAPGCNPSGGSARSSHPETLPQRLQSDNPAERVTAIVEAGQAGDRSVAALLVDGLEDQDSDVRMFAILSLQKITGETQGYRYYDNQQDRRQAVQRWRQWLTGDHGPATQPQASTRR